MSWKWIARIISIERINFRCRKSYTNKIISTNTIFRNPENGKLITVPPIRKATTGSLTMTVDNITGPINVGPSVPGYGVALSKKLMIALGLKDGDVVYFRDDDLPLYK